MRVKRRPRIRWFSLFFLLVLPVAAYGGVPDVSHVMVTDVTTTSFSVIWASSEASTASLAVYDDQDGNVAEAGAVITPHPVESGDPDIKTAAEDNGVMKVRVTDLEPDTTYYFMTITTSTSSPDTTHNPSAAPFTPVTTESEIVRTYESGEDVLPFSNDLIIEACYLNDGTTDAEGTLLLATLEGGNYPITAFVGDGVDPPYAIIDLNNIFSREAHENLDLSSGENLTLLNFRGLLGNSIVTHLVPEDQSLSEVKPPDFGLKAGVNFVSFQLEPGDNETTTILDPIINKVSAIWAYDAINEQWVFYDKYGPSFLNRLFDLHSFTGYWLIMEDDASWLINGTFSTNPIPLRAGSNLVGYRSIQTVELTDALGAIYDELESIWTYDTDEGRWIFYDKYGPAFLNRLKLIEPGKAYWVYVSDDCEW